ncbi:ArnT family glycosyltransferase [Mucilaginibacter terrae]|uniref:ArnT family glycosyltransferase n=1 Tax=Mucilaginibacter terrae TaxID=1955052 RepID=UPI003624D215
MIKSITRNPYIIFLPFLIFYACFIIINRAPELHDDEVRYLEFAQHLLKGFYSPKYPHINLWNGPGYPITLMPFAAFNVPVIFIALLNAIYMYMAVVFLYKGLLIITNYQTAILCGIIMGIYPNILSVLTMVYTEPLTYCLVSGMLYSIIRCCYNKETKYLIVAGLTLGFLTLTKIIFGYVLIMCLIICLAFILFKKYKTNYIRSAKVLLIAFACTLPYLAYTYTLTGKLLYWGNSGGLSLYWMSSPFNYEYGDWKHPGLTNRQYPKLYNIKLKEFTGLLKKNHLQEVKIILRHNEIDRDELFKQAAVKNIKHNPIKFLQNYYYNISRMLFNFPYSYAYQDAAIIRNILTGSLVLWSSLACLVFTIYNWRKTVYPVKFILLITGVYLLLSGALSAYPRQLDVMIPVLLFWCGFVKANAMKFNFKYTVEGQNVIDEHQLTSINIPLPVAVEHAPPYASGIPTIK